MLKPGMTVLDIGFGWAGFARWAAEKYHVKVLSYVDLLSSLMCGQFQVKTESVVASRVFEKGKKGGVQYKG